MEKEVFLIGEPNSFMVSAVEKGLLKEDYTVVRAADTVNDINAVAAKPGIWVLYLDEKTGDISNEMLVYIKDAVIENELFFYVIGNEDEIDIVKKVVGEDHITSTFLRPLNVSVLAQSLEVAFAKTQAANAKKRILIIDDNPTALRNMKNLLSDHYKVFMASSGMNGITFLAKNEVDLILLDYEMPVTDGPQVLEMLRSEPSTAGIPVMFLTAKSDKESVLKVVSLKPEKYLLKTMPPAELILNIDEFFNHKG